MTASTPGFEGFKITSYYKYILYVAGVILILSLFVDAPNIDNVKLRNIALWVVIAGLVVWFLKNVLVVTLQLMDKYDYEKYVVTLTSITYCVEFGIWLLTFFWFLNQI